MNRKHTVATFALGALIAASGQLVFGQDNRLRTQPGLPPLPEPGSLQGTPTQPPQRATMPVYDDGNV